MPKMGWTSLNLSKTQLETGLASELAVWEPNLGPRLRGTSPAPTKISELAEGAMAGSQPGRQA